MATRGMGSMSITNFESTIMANSNIMVEDSNTTVVEGLRITVEGSVTVNVQSTVAGVSTVTAANTEHP